MPDSLTHRQRVLLALEGKPTDRIPIAMVCGGINEPARGLLDSYLKQHRNQSLEEYLDPIVDIQYIVPTCLIPCPDGHDIWGVSRKPVSTPAGGVYHEIDHYPLAGAKTITDLMRHPWPSPAAFDYASLPERVAAMRAAGDPCIMTGLGTIFETAWYMRGFEQIFVDFLESPEFVHTLFAKIADFWMDHFRRTLEAVPGEIDLVFTADDIGGQNGLLMSPGMWESFIKPCHKRMNAMLHEFGVRVIYHSDGGVAAAVPGLIDMGIDILQALQFDADGMDPVALKRDFGDRLAFEGGVSVQKTLPFGTPEDVRREVEFLAETLGRGGKYILGPSHFIQAGTPTENILALFDTAVRQPGR